MSTWSVKHSTPSEPLCIKLVSGDKSIIEYDANAIMSYQGDLRYDLNIIAEVHNEEVKLIMAGIK